METKNIINACNFFMSTGILILKYFESGDLPSRYYSLCFLVAFWILFQDILRSYMEHFGICSSLSPSLLFMIAKVHNLRKDFYLVYSWCLCFRLAF